MTFEKVISLGPSCETAWQIRQIVDQPEAYVFDWLIARPHCVARVLRTDFSEIVHPEHLSLRQIESGERFYVYDEISGIEYHHDFRNDADFMDCLDDVQQKYNFLIERMRRLLESNSRILFVHQAGTVEDAKLLEAAVEGRFPRLDFRLLEISLGDEEPPTKEDGRVIFAQSEGRGESWQERLSEWEAMIEPVLASSFGRTLTRCDPALRGLK